MKILLLLCVLSCVVPQQKDGAPRVVAICNEQPVFNGHHAVRLYIGDKDPKLVIVVPTGASHPEKISVRLEGKKPVEVEVEVGQ